MKTTQFDRETEQPYNSAFGLKQYHQAGHINNDHQKVTGNS